MSNIEKSSIILVFNDKGELALQLRSATDDSYPSHWDFSAAGGIEIGENYTSAAEREMREEIGINGELIYLGEEKYKDSNGGENLYIFKTVFNGDFKINPKEVEKMEWFTLETIIQMLDSNEKFHPQFYFVWNKGYMNM